MRFLRPTMWNGVLQCKLQPFDIAFKFTTDIQAVCDGLCPGDAAGVQYVYSWLTDELFGYWDTSFTNRFLKAWHHYRGETHEHAVRAEQALQGHPAWLQ